MSKYLNKKYLLILLSVAFVVFVAKTAWNIGWDMGLQYGGICPELGRALTDDEKIRAVIKRMTGPVTGVVRMATFDEKTLMRKQDTGYLRSISIPYESVDAFLKENPNCCSVEVQDMHYNGEESWDSSKAVGAYAGHVTVNYMLNYIDENGRKKKKPDRLVYTIQTCGVVN